MYIILQNSSIINILDLFFISHVVSTIFDIDPSNWVVTSIGVTTVTTHCHRLDVHKKLVMHWQIYDKASTKIISSLI